MREKNLAVSKSMAKSGMVKSLTKSDSEMELVNRFALEALTADEVYLFKVAACDNDIDRDHERFDDASLEEMAELFVGKTMIKDHNRATDNQFARIYAANVESVEGEKTSDGLPLKQLVVKCYTLANESNAQLISEIKAGIKKEVSVSFMPDVVECSICGTDNRKRKCDHYWGKEYEGRRCHFVFKAISDAFELSFVAVPAQKNAGTRKDYLAEEESPPDEQEQLQHEDKAPDQGAFLFAKSRLRIAEAKSRSMKGSA